MNKKYIKMPYISELEVKIILNNTQRFKSFAILKLWYLTQKK